MHRFTSLFCHFSNKMNVKLLKCHFVNVCIRVMVVSLHKTKEVSLGYMICHTQGEQDLEIQTHNKIGISPQISVKPIFLLGVETPV